jgi:plasmid stabilization system protein ParE
MRFKLLPPAAAELRQAAKYYEARVQGLGSDFIIEVRATLSRIIAQPGAWQLLDEAIRRCRTHRFPYGIIYTVDNDSVLVLSVMHLHKHPDSWRKNL